MNKEHWEAMLPIIQAWLSGATVQYRSNPNSEWGDMSMASNSNAYVLFTEEVSNYRIKPGPREFHIEIVCKHKDGLVGYAYDADTKEGMDKEREFIKVREVIE